LLFEAKLCGDGRRQQTATGSDKISEITCTLRGSRQQGCLRHKVFAPTRLVGEEEEGFIAPVIEGRA
jgi:hypothetical protein